MQGLYNRRLDERVAPHVGAWIEMNIYNLLFMSFIVAPHVGAWIEIALSSITSSILSSRSSCRSVD